MSIRLPIPHLLRPGAGERFAIRSMGMTLVVPSAATDGQFCVFEATLAPGYVALPLHTHERETETSYVLEGELTAQVGDEVITARAGEALVRPRGVQHTVWNAGEQPVRFLDIVSPGGLDEWYREVAPLASARRPDVPAILAVSERYGLRFDMDSLLDLVGKHHVWLV